MTVDVEPIRPMLEDRWYPCPKRVQKLAAIPADFDPLSTNSIGETGPGMGVVGEACSVRGKKPIMGNPRCQIFRTCA